MTQMYGDKLIFIGNVNARVLSKSKEEIRSKFERKASITRGRRQVYCWQRPLYTAERQPR